MFCHCEERSDEAIFRIRLDIVPINRDFGKKRLAMTTLTFLDTPHK
jgi:hypothetical protein